MNNTEARLDDDQRDIRDWEGPIPGITPASKVRSSKRQLLLRRAREAVRSGTERIQRATAERPLIAFGATLGVLGAAIGVGAIAGASLRSRNKRTLLLTVASYLTRRATN